MFILGIVAAAVIFLFGYLVVSVIRMLAFLEESVRTSVALSPKMPKNL